MIATTKNAPGAIPEVQVAKPIRRDVAASLRLPATVSPYHQTTLYAKVSGYLKTIAVDKGDRVKAGQVLAVIDDPELGQRLQQAQSEYEIKKVTYERLANVRKALALDASAPDWPLDRADAILSINMVHISPWASALGLLDGAARFEYETEMLIVASRRGFQIESVPITTVYSDEVSSINPVRDTLRFFKLMRRYRKL